MKRQYQGSQLNSNKTLIDKIEKKRNSPPKIAHQKYPSGYNKLIIFVVK
jgi:hypothetical protein